MPVGAANLFSATDPKLVKYDYATSFFGGVAPLVSRKLQCCHLREARLQTDIDQLAAHAPPAAQQIDSMMNFAAIFRLCHAHSCVCLPQSIGARRQRLIILHPPSSPPVSATVSTASSSAGGMDWLRSRMLVRYRLYSRYAR